MVLVEFDEILTSKIVEKLKEFENYPIIICHGK